ncbi:MAG: hypothetical protein WAV48_05045 [Candidatus Magasanikiibacteriota bacterium]
MAKLIKDGEVAVLVSGGFGAGWSTWGKTESAVDGELAQAILDGEDKNVWRAIAAKNWPEQYDGGVEDLYVVWVPQGAAYEITEYDGSESLNIISNQTYQIA